MKILKHILSIFIMLALSCGYIVGKTVTPKKNKKSTVTSKSSSKKKTTSTKQISSSKKKTTSAKKTSSSKKEPDSTKQVSSAPQHPKQVLDAKSPDFRQEGLATYYSKRANGSRTSSGERILTESYTCAHRWLSFGTMVRVYCPLTDKTVIVKVIDRGPFARGRVIDLSWKAAHELGIISHGTAKVILTIHHEPESEAPKSEEKDKSKKE